MKRLGKLILSFAVTAAFTWWAFRDTDWKGQWASLRSANYLWLIPYFAILTCVHLCRTLRWGCLLAGLERVKFRALNEAAAIGFMMLYILPLRLGEFARPYLIARRSSIRKSAAMTSVVLERIIDGMFIAVLLRVLLFFVPHETSDVRFVRAGANLMFGVFGGGLLFLLFALWQQQRAVRLVRATAGRIAPKLANKVAEIVDAFVGAMRQLPGPRQIVAFFLYTIVYWGMNGIGTAVLARAFDCSTAGTDECFPMHLNLFQAFVVLSVVVVGLMIPGAPGAMGTFQWAIKTGLTLFLPSAVVISTGIAFANVMWLCQSTQQILFGLIFLTTGHLSFREITKNLKKEAESPSAAAT